MFYGVSVWNWGDFFKNFCVLNKEAAAARFSLCSRTAAKRRGAEPAAPLTSSGTEGEDAELQEIRGAPESNTEPTTPSTTSVKHHKGELRQEQHVQVQDDIKTIQKCQKCLHSVQVVGEKSLRIFFSSVVVSKQIANSYNTESITYNK